MYESDFTKLLTFWTPTGTIEEQWGHLFSMTSQSRQRLRTWTSGSASWRNMLTRVCVSWSWATRQTYGHSGLSPQRRGGSWQVQIPPDISSLALVSTISIITHSLHYFKSYQLFALSSPIQTLFPHSNPFPHLWFFKSMTLKLTFELLLWWDLWSLGLLLWSAFLLYLLMIWTYCVLYFSEITMYVDNFFLGIWTLPYLLPIPVFFYTKFMQTSDKIMRVY